MRRLFSIALLTILVGLQAVAIIEASMATAEWRLPACCRGRGAHHCAMYVAWLAAQTGNGPAWTAPPDVCPMYAHPGTSLVAHAAPPPPVTVTQQMRVVARCLWTRHTTRPLLLVARCAARAPPLPFA